MAFDSNQVMESGETSCVCWWKIDLERPETVRATTIETARQTARERIRCELP